MKILLCGGGNANHVLSSYIASQEDCQVKIWSLYDDEAERLEQSVETTDKGIQCINDLGPDTYGKPIQISKNPQDVVPDSDVILLSLPAFAHEMYLKAMAPYINKKGVIIGALPAEGGFDLCVRDSFGSKLADDCIIFATETLPWACRIKTFGKIVEVLGTKKDIDISVTPEKEFNHVSTLLSKFCGQLPHFHSAGNFLAVTLMNINSVWHPTITYGQYRNWDEKSAFSSIPLFYQGADEYTGEKLTLVSNEVLKIKEELLIRYPKLHLNGIRHVKEWMLRAYGEDIGDTSSLYRMLQTNKGYRGLLHPMISQTNAQGKLEYLPNFNYRYMTEDIPCGLIVTRGIAELLLIETPHIDEILLWCQRQSHKEFLKDGKLIGKDLNETRCPQRYGFHSIEEFMKANHYIE